MSTDPLERVSKLETIIDELTQQAVELRSTPREMAAVVSELHTIKKMIADAWEHVSGMLADVMGDDPEIEINGAIVEKRIGAPRKAWKHAEIADEVARRIISSAVDMDTGEVMKSPEEMMKEMLSYGAVSYWRVKNLSKIGVIADEYCEVGEPKTSIVVRQAMSIVDGQDPDTEEQ